jgi:hypothetical protein
MSTSITDSHTYTAADIVKVADRFAADLAMIAQSTQKLTSGEVGEYVSDITALAKAGYLERISLVLFDGSRNEVRARRYQVSTNAELWSSDRPGGNLWPQMAGGSLEVIVSYSSAWRALSDSAKTNFKAGLQIAWSPSSVDVSFPGLTGTPGRRYASKAYGMQRTDFE